MTKACTQRAKRERITESQLETQGLSGAKNRVTNIRVMGIRPGRADASATLNKVQNRMVQPGMT